MDHRLKKIKRLILDGRVKFTLKAEMELDEDHLEKRDIYEAILNAGKIDKVLNSSNPFTGKKEKMYIIKGITYDDLIVYTKGKIAQDQFYILISSKRAL